MDCCVRVASGRKISSRTYPTAADRSATLKSMCEVMRPFRVCGDGHLCLACNYFHLWWRSCVTGSFTGGSTGQSSKAAASEEDGVDFIESKIASLRQFSGGKWLFVLEDGARWSQTEPARLRSPKVGDTIRIRKAALGSYLANINGRTAIRVKREN